MILDLYGGILVGFQWWGPISSVSKTHVSMCRGIFRPSAVTLCEFFFLKVLDQIAGKPLGTEGTEVFGTEGSRLFNGARQT